MWTRQSTRTNGLYELLKLNSVFRSDTRQAVQDSMDLFLRIIA
jgi:hypothetical protein